MHIAMALVAFTIDWAELLSAKQYLDRLQRIYIYIYIFFFFFFSKISLFLFMFAFSLFEKQSCVVGCCCLPEF